MNLGNDSVRIDMDSKMFIQGHTRGINDFRWCPFNDSRLLTAGDDGTVRVKIFMNFYLFIIKVWNLSDEKEDWPMKKHSAKV